MCVCAVQCFTLLQEHTDTSSCQPHKSGGCQWWTSVWCSHACPPPLCSSSISYNFDLVIERFVAVVCACAECACVTTKEDNEKLYWPAARWFITTLYRAPLRAKERPFKEVCLSLSISQSYYCHCKCSKYCQSISNSAENFHISYIYIYIHTSTTREGCEHVTEQVTSFSYGKHIFCSQVSSVSVLVSLF